MAELELLDIVDESGNILGQATRAEFHSNPKLIHQVVHCWIFNSMGQILWQQRSLQKATSPGVWDMSCGGHVISGDTAEVTILKELHEELGLKEVTPVLVDKYVEGSESQTELIYLYYLVIDKKSTEFVLQLEEVEKVEWVDIDKAMKLILTKQRTSTEWIFTQVPKILQKIFSEVRKITH